VSIAALEEEISDMEAQLERSKGYMESARTEHEAVNGLIGTLSKRSDLVSELEASHSEAESNEIQYSTISGISNWCPVELKETELSFQLVGPLPKTCVLISFQVPASGPLICKARIQPELYPKHKIRSNKQFKTKSITSFLEERTLDICTVACKEQLKKPADIGPLLQRLEWELGRVKHTAQELAMLERRYHAIISPSGSSVEVEVEFSNQTKDAKLFACFGLSGAYPFSPLIVTLDTEGKVDVESMRKLLIKNAKPGFGYLSRTFDVIAAYIR